MDYFDIENYLDEEAYYNSYVILNCDLRINFSELLWIMSELTKGVKNVNSSLGMFSRNKDNSITLFKDYIEPIETENDSDAIFWIKEYCGDFFKIVK